MPSTISTSTIARQAFRLMELRSLSSLGDGTPQALAAAEQYPVARDMCLAAHDWSFARRMVALPPVAALPEGLAADPDLSGLFSLPADLLVLRRVLPDGLAYRLDGTLLRADQTTALTVLYTARLETESAWPAAFRTAVSLQLAVLLAPEWVGSRTKRGDLRDELPGAMQAAMRDDRQSASHARLDGRDAQSDWAEGAVL